VANVIVIFMVESLGWIYLVNAPIESSG